MEKFFKQIQGYSDFDLLDIILLSLLFVFLIVQLYYYISYYKKPLSEAKKRLTAGEALPMQQFPKVSVIIVSENESENLALNLPHILEQDYPNFEVIVVNDGSTDESDILLESLKIKYPNLYNTFLPVSPDKQFNRRKLTLTMGAKAATGDILLFTEPYSKPISNKWISAMTNGLSDGKDIVLGYSFYKINNKNLFNRGARFRNLILSLQYMSMAIKNKPYTGVFRNVAFRKELFFTQKGFSSLLNIENGEDLFINRVANGNNTSVALSQESFIETDLYSLSLWKQIKSSSLKLRKYFMGFTPKSFNFEYITRFLFYLLLLILILKAVSIMNPILGAIASLLFIIRYIVQLLVVNKSGDYFKSGKFILSLELLDISQLFDYMNFRRLLKRK